MSKIIWGIGTLAVLVSAGAGAKWYADQSLTSYYEQSRIAKNNYLIQYQNYKMGAVSGSADVKFTLQRDPCVEQSKMIFVGQDNIKRTWQGYKISSTLELQNKNDKYANLFKQPIHAETIIQWTGQVKTKIDLPKIDMDIGQMKLQLDPALIKVHSQVKDKTTVIKDMEFTLANARLMDQKGHMQVRDVSFKTNQGMNPVGLESGYTEWKTDQIQMSLNKPDASSVMLKGLEVKMDTVLHDKTADIKTLLKIGQVMTAQNSQYQKAEFHFDFKELNRTQLDQYFKLFSQKDTSCAASKSFDADALKSLVSVFNSGFMIESKDNHMQTTSGDLKANLQAKIMPNYVNSAEMLKQMLPSLIDAEMDINFDQKMLVELLKLKPSQNGQVSTQQQVEMTLKALEEKGQIKREGSSIKMGMQYKFGQPIFKTL